MPIPIPRPKEDRMDYMLRCMADPVMIAEYRNQDQRRAVCAVTYQKNKR